MEVKQEILDELQKMEKHYRMKYNELKYVSRIHLGRFLSNF